MFCAKCRMDAAVLTGLALVALGACLIMPFGHGAVMDAVRDGFVRHAYRRPEFWRHILITGGIFLCGLGVAVASLRIKDRIVRISERGLFSAAYLYMAAPIVIFFLGFLKLPLGLLFSAVLLYGFYRHIKDSHSGGGHIELQVKSVVLIAAFVAVWIWSTGIGGLFVQRYDLHWRNAVVRDLVDFSWPVIFPETDKALVYYYIFWMVPAVFGKLFGFLAANIVLYLWSCAGICLMELLLIRYLKAYSLNKVFALLLVTMLFGGLDYFGYVFCYCVKRIPMVVTQFAWQDFFTGIQYVPNNSHLEWAHNQVVVPWLATALFFNDRSVKSLGFLGLLILPFAPLPFLGFFVIAVGSVAAEAVPAIRQKNFKAFALQIFSIPNVCAILSIFIVFLAFFRLNAATNGTVGGLGLAEWINNITPEVFVSVALFFIIDVYAYPCLVFQENKRRPLFYIITVPMFFYPFIKLGTSRDFVLRAWIPAQIAVMVFVLEVLFKDGRMARKKCAIICCLTISSLNFLGSKIEYVQQLASKRIYPMRADGFYTFSYAEKSPNYVVAGKAYKSSVFFRFLAKKRKDDSDAYLDRLYRLGLSFCEGEYIVSPAKDQNQSLMPSEGLDLRVSAGRFPFQFEAANGHWGDNMEKASDKYRIRVPEKNMQLEVPFGRGDGDGSLWLCGITNSAAQEWNVQPAGDCYKIIWNGYALACDAEGGRVYLALADGSDSQLWRIERAEPNECGCRFDEWKRAQGRGDGYILRRTFVFSDWLSEAWLHAERYTVFLAVRSGAAVGMPCYR